MRRIAALILAVVLAFGCGCAAAADAVPKFEGEGFETIDALIDEYVRCLNEGDFYGMMACYAIESYVDHADPEAFLGRLGAAQIKSYVLLPASSDFSRQVLAANRYSNLAKFLYEQFVVYTFEGTEYEDLTVSKTVPLKGEEQIRAFVETGANTRLNDWKGNVRFLRYTDPGVITDGRYDLEINQRNLEKLRICHGCDVYKDQPCYLEINGEIYVLAMGYGCYDGRWYIVDAGYVCAILGIDRYYQGLFPLVYLG